MQFTGMKAAACAVAIGALTACGGGQDNGAADSSGASFNQRLSAASVVPVGSQDTVIVVSLPFLSAGNTIATKDAKGGTVKLYKNDGKTVVTSLDDLPEGLANHAWTKNANAVGHLRLQFTPDVYRFNTGWAWPALASGHDAARQIVIEQKPGTTGDVALMGSKDYSGTYSSSKGKVTLTSLGNQGFEQLWAEGSRAIRARTPNVGSFFYVRSGAQGWPAATGSTTMVSTLNGAPVQNQAFQADATAYAALSAIKTANDTNAVVVLTDSWQVTKHRVAEVDSAGQRVRLSPASYWGLGANGSGQRYFIENTASALDAPAEWFFSVSGSTGTLDYKPKATLNNGSTVKFEVPRVEKLLSMQGNVTGGKWLEYVQFSGLKFRYAKTTMPSAGYLDSQADTGVAAAIELNDARFIEFSNCEVSHTGGYGIWLNSRVRNVTVASSELYDLGAGGIKVGKSRSPVVTQADWDDVNNPASSGQNTIDGNRIHSLGHVYPGSVAVWVGRSSNNVVQNNLIKDTTYSGISVGWTWDTGPTMASGNKVLNNFLYNIGQRALADMGGIYLLGRAPGTVVQGNVIKEVRSFDGYAYGGNGIYADEGSSELNLQGNIVLGVSGNGIVLHYGENNAASGNVVASTDTAFGVSKRAAGSTAVPLTLSGNLFAPTRNAFVAMSNDDTLMANAYTDNASWLSPAPALSNNKVSPKYLPTGTTLAIPSLCTGCVADTATTITDSATLKVPAISGMGFTPGTNVARHWDTATLSSTISAARLWAGNVNDVPPKVIDFRASQWPLGPTALQGWQVINQAGQTVDPQDPTVAVSIQKDADGTQYLALNDTARKDFTWEPYIQNTLNYASGTTAKVSFKARFDANTNLMHVWRSDDNGTTAGPMVEFVASGSVVNVNANGRLLATVPQGVWVSFDIVSPVKQGSTWSLTVTPAGAAAKTYTGLTPLHTTWEKLGPVLFISNANVRTTTALASISMSRQ